MPIRRTPLPRARPLPFRFWTRPCEAPVFFAASSLSSLSRSVDILISVSIECSAFATISRRDSRFRQGRPNSCRQCPSALLALRSCLSGIRLRSRAFLSPFSCAGTRIVSPPIFASDPGVWGKTAQEPEAGPVPLDFLKGLLDLFLFAHDFVFFQLEPVFAKTRVLYSATRSASRLRRSESSSAIKTLVSKASGSVSIPGAKQ